jgi:hypothetical protein
MLMRSLGVLLFSAVELAVSVNDIGDGTQQQAFLPYQ